MAQNIHAQILSELGQDAETRSHLYRKIERNLSGRKLVTFFTSFRYPVQIDDDDVDMLQSVLKNTNVSKGLALMISSPGGIGLSAERIVNVCKAYSGTNDFWVIVPGKAKSAATMISLGASKIYMAASSELGPVDPQFPISIGGRVRWFSAHGLVKTYDNLFNKAVKSTGRIEPYIQQLDRYDSREVNDYRSAIRLSEDITIKLLKQGMMKKKTKRQIKKDIKVFLDPEAGTLTHGRPIFNKEAKKCGVDIVEIDVNSSFWDDVYQLYARLERFVSRQASKAVESGSEAFFVPPPPPSEEG